MEAYHRPIMVGEVLEGLALGHGGTYLDGTCGGGGHSRAILERDKTARLIAMDKDDEAIGEASKTLSPYMDRVRLVHSDFKQYEEALQGEKLEGFLLDLGISSHQIDDPTRGFAYRMADAPLDMRMDRRQQFTAGDVVNGYSEEELRRILREYGEEPFAAVIAKNIVRERAKKQIKTCGELKALIEDSLPPRLRSAACARQSFQAIRIEVNGELDGLETCLRGLVGQLKTGGRACVLTFHSLEDRIVKRVFRDLSTDCVCPKTLPVCVCGRRRQLRLVTKSPLMASEEEQEANPRSKSAKLRIAEKVE